MHNACQGVHGLPIQQKVQADQVCLALLSSLVVEAGVARGDGLEGVVEVASELCQRQSVSAGPAASLRNGSNPCCTSIRIQVLILCHTLQEPPLQTLWY